MTGPTTALLTALLIGGSAFALSVSDTNTISGAARVIDGDTLAIGETRVRLAAIDAPETQQVCWDQYGLPWQCGARAKIVLTRMLADANWQVTCEPTATDRYGRTIATCRTPDKRDIGARMVATGNALAYRQFGGARYLAEESAARAERLGVWSGTFEWPWDWRRAHKSTH